MHDGEIGRLDRIAHLLLRRRLSANRKLVAINVARMEKPRIRMFSESYRRNAHGSTPNT